MTRTDMAPAMAEGGMPPVGEHLLLDLYGVSPALLRDAALLESTLREAADALGATVLHAHLHRFGAPGANAPAEAGGGVTGVLLLAESHLSIHTWPEHGFAAIDAFMCGTGATLAARAIFERALAPSRVDVRVTLRGGLPG
ncbi:MULTISPECIES: adenosylmethionine decarboxylase [Ralstonia solanacearum species complex]|uniref:S-adenosylmethionine decarboxylase proenzyme n=4 Tax=Ralstonia solanacearum species complex TaxID=3116862 RepID=A0A0K1ZTF5_RALSL|nr:MULTISPECIES: adenosylmethionine decarboxylase [Ralstonia]AKZ29152.1 S-adenosylmethionine decarboxylase [Ralstonia solanacearum]AVV67608.1 adenosylmethionine decarboxylase [Ralstonia solanacearum OE1-1]AGH87298.1 S-adenosylmethionine decarboxylase proenzyme [Ralstonia pseudosolanacearum FQY_4]API77773.1 S-adenosylmethionine decarboxylase [Ralstonia pseudosolanacearum]AST30253.1 adenosylmethionine decarboxylase [Ralstonia pseudosolanacearum]